ncbi:MAG: hypothetical protein PHZ26_00855 [Candidatus Gracilibacteria bacterium]|nr:hypothetical protein [Candidatus Gracilibacteria bacterium]MDD2908284.1 hypothetical protein [Candidatus Gracilibacteria bacterium]
MKNILIKILIASASFGLFVTSYAGTFTDTGDSNDTVIYCNPSDGTICDIDSGVAIVNNGVSNIQKDKTFFQYVQDMLIYILGFVALIGVLYIIYAGFNILNAAGDDSKVKKSKSIITYVIIGIMVMFLAYPLIKWVLVLINQ